MEKQAYSQLERGEDGRIRVVFYDTGTGMPIDDLTGYQIIALDQRGQPVPVSKATPSGAPQPAPTAELPPLQGITAENASFDQLTQVVNARENGGSVPEMDLEPTNAFLGPRGLVSSAFGNDLAYTNDKLSNKALQTGIGLAAGAAIGGPVGMAVGALAGGYVNSDRFKNEYNDRGQLNRFGVGMGLPQAPSGPKPQEAPFGADPVSTAPTPVDSLTGNVQNSYVPEPTTQNIGQQRTNIPSSSPPIDGGYQQPDDMRQAPSMFAFNRREPPTGSKGTVETFDRTGLSPGANKIADRLASDIPGLGVNSGFRSAQRNAEVGGAKNSQHIQGNALDINISGMTNEQKRDVLESAVRGGARGVGIYASGNSLHVDSRTNPTQWGQSGRKGYAGGTIESMPEWSHDTLRAMHGAGPTGQVGPRIGPTPKSREQALSERPIEREKLGPVGSRTSYSETDLAFAERPDFGGMTAGQVASSGYGKRPSDAQIDAMAYTLAGELDPREMNNPQAVANLAATINNRIETVGVKDTFTGTQYNSLLSKNRRVTDENYGRYGEALKQSIRDFYDGKNQPTTPDATHYYNPDISNPNWGSKLTNTVVEGGHRIGNIPGEYQRTKEQQERAKKEADDRFTERSLASQAGRNVENTDKALSGDRRTSVSGFASRREKEARGKDPGPGSLVGSRHDDGRTGFASRSTLSGKEKDDRGVGLGSRSSGSTKSSGLNTSNAKSMSTRSKDDTTKSSSSKSSSSKNESSKVDKDVTDKKGNDKGGKKSGV